MAKACPNCKSHSWIICPKCGGYACRSCRLNRNGKKMTASNHCTYCNYIGSGWKTDTRGPSWGI